jgi:hypothetical protein
VVIPNFEAFVDFVRNQLTKAYTYSKINFLSCICSKCFVLVRLRVDFLKSFADMLWSKGSVSGSEDTIAVELDVAIDLDESF